MMINYSFNDRMNGFQHPNVLLKKRYCTYTPVNRQIV